MSENVIAPLFEYFCNPFNPFKPIGITQYYQLDKSINVLTVVGR